MLRTDKSRGYCLEMIGADFLAGANLESSNPEILLHSIPQFFKILTGEQRGHFPHKHIRRRNGSNSTEAQPHLRLDSELYEQLCRPATY